MVASRSLMLTAALACAACTSAATQAPPASPGSSAAQTPSTTPAPPSSTATAVSSPVATAPPGVDPAIALEIAAPYALEQPTAEDLANLSGQIRALPSSLAKAAGTGYAAADFPLGVRFVRTAGSLVGVVVLVPLPDAVAMKPGVFESVAAAAAAVVNAPIAYDSIGDVKIGVVRGPIASTLAFVDGHLVFAQTGQPAIDPKDLLAAIIAANDTLGS